MNTNNSINKSLEEQNRMYHEASVCNDCAVGDSVKGGKWTTKDQLGKLDEAGFVQFYDGINVLVCALSHVLLLGSTGSGKTEVIINNQINLSAEMKKGKRPSYFITDLKGDLFPLHKKKLEKAGYIVKCLNLRESFKSIKYNPILQIYDDYVDAEAIKTFIDGGNLDRYFDGIEYSSSKKAKNAAKCKRAILMDCVERAIVETVNLLIVEPDPKNKSWCDGARTMSSAILWCMLRYYNDPNNPVTREKFTLSNLCAIANSTGDDCDELIDWLKHADDIQCVKNALAANYEIRAKQTRDSYISTLNTHISEYIYNAIETITATSDDLNIREIATSDKPYAIFIVTDDRQKITNNICMMFINSLVKELVSYADSRPSRSLDRDFIILADEFANMPPMPNLSNLITTLRSRKIWMVMAVQSLAQLEMVYGKETCTILLDNCDRQIFIGSNNDETKERFAKSMGETIGVKTSYHIANDGSMSASKSTENVSVVKKSDLSKLELGEFYVRTRSSDNYKSYMLPFFMQEHDYPPDFGTEDVEKWCEPGKFRYDIFKSRRHVSKKFDFDF